MSARRVLRGNLIDFLGHEEGTALAKDMAQRVTASLDERVIEDIQKETAQPSPRGSYKRRVQK